MAKSKTIYVCSNCGYESAVQYGVCPNCHEFDTMKPAQKKATAPLKQKSLIGEEAVARSIDEISIDDLARIETGVGEFDRVLGGGVVPGSLVLISGDPGIGKSTILLQIASRIVQQGKKVLYVSGEESATQIKRRAERLAVSGKDLIILSTSDFDQVESLIESVKPDILVVDSIQTMELNEIDSPVGSVSLVKELTSHLMKIAKTQNITTFIVGHITKDGTIAGPKILEHMVDTVIYIEGDKFHLYRIMHTVKNRFGSTDEIGLFEMHENGLKEVLNPSELFLQERLKGANGSAVVVSMEGTRPILVEIQALLTPTLFGNARRTATGIDFNRVSLIMAVLEKRANILLQNQDAYIKVTGGVRLDEPAIDFACAMAIASSFKNKEIPATDCFIGELGLAGEARSVNRIELRIAEAEKLGFKKIFVPANNLKNYHEKPSIKVVGVKTLAETIKKVLG
ncbi:DNA repair protein RadA [Xylocopilactobacillus apicola]|uniref:DNA repair protein RadA n=1 Tax=Xylocopilactobacillus apicola TaxID=2932184 RepID=A0AAU9DK39_9LACO|nr:DNA repair protein RadA [Xylocopilactobacillus apicola]BDR58891.1 DNA repair protein RadA [Xylocopilactobacillus apicola]